MKWRVLKQADIADTDIIIRDISDVRNVIFRNTVPYFKRSWEINLSQEFDKKLKNDASYQICLLARDSQGFVRSFFQEQCKDLSSKFSTAPFVSYGLYMYVNVLLVIFTYLLA